MAPAVRGKAHMAHKTQHCPDDEPLRITLAKAILAASHTLDDVTLDDGVIICTSANMLAVVRLQCTGHLFVANCIHTSPASLPSSLSPTTERLFIASLSVAFSVEIHSQTHTFRITCLDVPRNLSKPSQHSELLCKESRGQVGHYLLSCVPLTSVTPSWVPRSPVGRSGSSRNVTHPHIWTPLHKQTKCSVISVLFCHT